MRPTTLDELEWLHDCVVSEFAYETASNSGRSIKIEMICPFDLGYPLWDGKRLVLAAARVAMSKHVMWGVDGPESIDAVRPGISDEARESTLHARNLGIHFPALEFTISFHSGSWMEIICHDLEINV
jgi:hypothetical protein